MLIIGLIIGAVAGAVFGVFICASIRVGANDDNLFAAYWRDYQKTKVEEQDSRDKNPPENN